MKLVRITGDLLSVKMVAVVNLVRGFIMVLLLLSLARVARVRVAIYV